MHYAGRRRTACISTQAGCALGCVFCATGQMGFARHLSAAEMVEQALLLAQELTGRGERLSNVVLMGMGEPFHNYDESLLAVRRLMGDPGHWRAAHHHQHGGACAADSAFRAGGIAGAAGHQFARGQR